MEPQPGKFSKKGLRFYDRVIATMRRYGIRPLITLNHWDYPVWVYDQGGWTNPKTVNDFLGDDEGDRQAVPLRDHLLAHLQ